MVRFSQLALALVGFVEARWLGIPTSPFRADDGLFNLSDISSIVIDEQFAESVDEKGETLIPPTLHAFGKTFANDLEELGIKTTVEVGTEAVEGSLFITLGDVSDYHDAAGRESSEGYSLAVSSSGIRITGASPLGAWWATRTILQQAILANRSIPYGSVVDTPGWNSRGMMLDAGRHYYPPEFLIELCAYMSFFKQNTFHLHLSDNLWNNKENYTRERSLELYARFRLWSEAKELEGLNKHKNESYTRNQFDQIQSSCAARGVTVLPEIEAPGHALVFVQWKPELGLNTDLSLLNISHPSTIPTMKTVWNTILPWFHTKTVHIGADEYTADIQDYNIFVNAMADHISSVSNKSIRIWGTFPPRTVPSGAPQIYRNVSIQHWEFFEDNPLHDYIKNGYSVMNSDDTYYVVTKWSGSYPQKVNITRTFIGNPATRGGGLWYPYVFDTKNVSNNPEINESRVLGSIVPLWNDYGPNSSTFSEAYYAWREGIPALADKQWGGDLNAQEFQQVFTTIHPFIPGQNLDRRIPSKTPTILEYSFNNGIGQATDPRVIPDLSGNGYNGSTDCKMPSNGSITIKSCSLLTPLSSKGRDYTLTVSLQVDALTKPPNASLITGSDSTLMLTPEITFFAGGEYFRLNNTLPLGKRLDLSIIGRGNQTLARINNGDEMDFRTKMGVNGQKFEWGPMAFEAPLREVGGKESGWTGQVYALKLTNIGQDE